MLLETMKKSVANRERDKIWSTGLKVLDWEIVAFQHFTAEECRAKWDEIMRKLRKIKTLTELITDAQKAMEDSDLEAKIKRPKKPMNASAFFFVENKDKLKRRKPGVSSQELMTYANEKYRNLTSTDKEKYLQQAKEAQKRYKLAVDELRSTQQLVKKKKKTSKKETDRKKDSKKETDSKKKDSKKETDSSPIKKKTPARRINAYQLFCREQMPHMAGTPRAKITSVWSERWKMLSQEEKDEYTRRSNKMNAKKEMFPGEPKMPTSSVCGLYCKNKFAEMKGKEKSQKEQRELFAKFSRESKNMPQREREQYQTEINNSLRIYKGQLNGWFQTLKPKKQLQYCELKPSKLKYLQSKLSTSHHRTSDSEDEDFDDSSSDDELTVIEIDREIEEEDELFHEMFDIF